MLNHALRPPRVPLSLLALALTGAGCAPPSAAADDPDAPDVLLQKTAAAVNPAVLWLVDENDQGTDQAYVGMTVDVKGRFPASFRLHLCDPPPPEAFLQEENLVERVGNSGLQMATGRVIAVREGQLSDVPRTVPADQAADTDFVRGEESRWDLVYLSQDVPPGPIADELFGGAALPAGYHLLSSDDGSEPPRGLRTRLHISLRPEP